MFPQTAENAKRSGRVSGPMILAVSFKARNPDSNTSQRRASDD